MANAFDLTLLAFLVVSSIPELLFMPALRRTLAAGSTTARPLHYAVIMAFEWSCFVAVIALWIAFERPWTALLLGPVMPAPIAAGLTLAALIAWLPLRSHRRVLAAGEERLQRLRTQLSALEFFVPHTPAELGLFRAVSLSAGICEEIVYRGFVLWVAASYVGLFGAAILQAIVFGLAHVYLGNNLASAARAFTNAAVLGVLFALVAIVSGSLIPAMLLHVLVDVTSGDIAYRLFRSDEGPHSNVTGSTRGWSSPALR